VQNVYRSGITQPIHSTKRIAAIVLRYLNDTRAAETSHTLRIAMPATALRYVQGVSDMILDGLRERAQIPETGSDADHRLQRVVGIQQLSI
jgi:hypothetical protein